MRREAIENDGFTQYLTHYPSLFSDLVIWDTTRYTDWQKVLLEHPATFQNAQVNLSGGNNATQFLIGMCYSEQGVTFPGNYADQKPSMHFSLTNTSPDSRLTTHLSASYTYDKSNLPGNNPTNKILLPPNAPPLYDSHDNLNWTVYNGTATFGNPLGYTVTKALANSTFISSTLGMTYRQAIISKKPT